ncbi:MAG TPA: HAMP domain-containing sensor histidine kinase [Gemmatimonadales bacterium]|nr:HAMP domain-containing sensor histidine kinase [Gemmatimonadales bacterium]
MHEVRSDPSGARGTAEDSAGPRAFGFPAGPRSLRTQLVFELGFLMSAAVLMVGVATAAMAGANLRDTAWALVALWLGSTVVFVLFGTYLVGRLVLRPLERLGAEANTLAAGRLDTARPAYETMEFAHLADRYRAMAEDLLDVQSQVVRVEKLAGIGSLAAGVAHEVRNPLGALGTYVELLRRRGGDLEVAEAMQGAIERIERTVRSLLAYARPDHGEGTTDINGAVRTSLDFLGAQGLLKGQRMSVNLAPDLPPVCGGQHLLEQVVVNLVVNACQASPGGVLALGTTADQYEPRDRGAHRAGDGWSTEFRGADPARAARHQARPRRPDVAPGTPGVVLYVADDGPGVPDENRERVFDPFYTTKDPGEGTGLGLAIVARTVHESGGTVWVDRAREGGAVFKVFLPAALRAATPVVESSHAPAHR